MALNTSTVIIGKDPEKVVLMLEILISSIKKSQGIISCDVQSFSDIHNPDTLHTTIRLHFVPYGEQHG